MAGAPEAMLRVQELLQAAVGAAVARRRVVLLAVAFYLAYATLRLLVRAARFVHTYFIRPDIDPKTFGSWAVVTGATDGMGRALAHQLAQKGLNIMLISRSEPKLRECAAELKERYGVDTRWLAADLCKAGPETYNPIRAALQSIEVGILVNNAGLGPIDGVPEYLEEQPPQFIVDLVTINCLMPTMLTKMVLAGMRERKRGLIINVGSIIANFDAPLVAAYGASKRFLDNLSVSVNAEYEQFGVRVQNLWAGSVATKMPGIKTASLAVPSPATWAAAAMRQLGREDSITPYWVHAVIDGMMRATPTSVLNRNVRAAMQQKRLEAKQRKAA
ncbi:hypothetical protein COHA_000857 [Chlorella ohadii]|uniref:Uncharacterized protein n=1 Tax=Chlorella ohadii TaxID=2649997 RepID=A0AAD5H8Q3_9CHLO|nr:hypothetical protein COHA_000857 [Chlorella ohadii]